MKAVSWAGAALLALLPVASHATEITTQLTHLSGQHWQLDLGVVNDGLPALGEFSVYFADTYFANLGATAPASWDAAIALPDPGLHEPGYVDFLADIAPLAAGQSLGGFSITFDYFGTGLPGSFAYDVFADDGFSVIDSGMTVAGSVAAVPEPATTALMLAGLVGIGAAFGLRKRAAAEAV